MNNHALINNPRVIIAIVYLCVLILAVFQITVSNMFATGGIDLDSMQKKIAVYKKEDLILSQKIYSQSSLFTIASEAATMGFVPEKSSIFLPTALPIALKP